jgi:hypothetical protein
MLLKVGRHIRPRDAFKLIIARDAGESKFLEGYRKQYPSLYAVSHSGPMALIDGEFTDDDFELAAGIVGRFGQGREAAEVEVKISLPDGDEQHVKTAPLTKEFVRQEWYL